MGNAVAAEPPAESGLPAERSRLLVLMFTDLVGSTALKDSLTTAGYLPLLRPHDELLRDPAAPPIHHLAAVNRASFSPDGAMVLTASNDKTARVWDPATGTALTPAFRHNGFVNFAAFDTAASQVVTASGDMTASIWPIAHTSLPEKDLLAYAELLAAHCIDAAGTLTPLNAVEWQQRFTNLSSRHPELFLPPATRSVLASELARAPADSARLKMYGEWFHQRGENVFAVQLLESARSAGAEIDPLLLARCEWLADRPGPATSEFEKALAANQDPRIESYLKQCIAAVKRGNQ